MRSGHGFGFGRVVNEQGLKIWGFRVLKAKPNALLTGPKLVVQVDVHLLLIISNFKTNLTDASCCMFEFELVSYI